MDPRFSLRFQSGERSGELIPIPEGGFTVGRRPGNSLQVLDNSVSGRHAEFLIDERGVTVKDLGSTNGTRVGDLRVLEQRVSHGDLIVLGNVEFLLVDARLGSVATAAEALSKTKEVPGPDGLQRVSAERIARAKRVSRPGILVLVLAALGGGVWWYLNRSSGGSSSSVRPVAAVPGNLLGDEASFESDTDSWSSAVDAPQAFLKTARARRSGQSGVAAELGAGEWALARSRDWPLRPGATYTVAAALRRSGDARVRVGLEFSRTAPEGAGGTGPLYAWSSDAADDGWSEARFEASAPAGYDRVRVLLWAHSAAGGGGAADDVALTEGAPGAAPLAIGNYTLALPCSPGTSAALASSTAVLLSGLEFTRPGATPLWEGERFQATLDGPRLRLASAAPREAFALRCESALAAGGIATIGADGYKTHGRDFERAAVKDLLLGGKGDFVRLSFDVPVRLSGEPEGSAVRLVAEAAGLSAVALQLEFKSEREQAGNLAYAARSAEKKGELGECLRQWSALLDTYPYEDKLVEEAEAARSRLSERGLAEVREVRLESERARFFRLVDLYRQGRERARAIAKRYAGSEVEREALALVREVEQDLTGLEAELDAQERERLAQILRSLEAQKATGLAGEVRNYLAKRPGAASAPRAPAEPGAAPQ